MLHWNYNNPIFEQILEVKRLSLLIVLCTSFLLSNSQVYWQQKVNFKIAVSLNDKENTLDAFETMEYTNNSPDTLTYIWIHLWPNAFKNDKTAFSDQQLENSRTDFYFSNAEERGYINRLDFKVNGLSARLDDHPLYIDIGKLILPVLLLPQQTIIITTPFHEKIPYNFSRGGHIGQSYQITQWYPKPAVYDKAGWHQMPYLDQGEFYSEFGNYEVQITIPANYVVAATGELQNDNEKKWLKERINNVPSSNTGTGKNKSIAIKNKGVAKEDIASSPEFKTLVFKQNNVHDFAWFADKRYVMDHDTLQLASKRVVDVYAFYSPSSTAWKKSVGYIKDAVRARSSWIGEYPYNVVKAWETKMGFAGGMEYPTITSISPNLNDKQLDATLEHEVGHNWFYGILATNERDHPWMDEGMNTYFDLRYNKLKNGNASPVNIETKSSFLRNRLPDDPEDLLYQTVIKLKKDQPIETTSPRFSDINYNLIAYYKTGKWMQHLEKEIGTAKFDSSIQEYYNRWKFKHPGPADFEKVVSDISAKNVASVFYMLHTKGSIEEQPSRSFKLASFISFRNTDKYKYTFLSPALGYNHYDKFMAGLLVHNFTLPPDNFQYIVSALYGTGSKEINALGRLQYTRRSYGKIQKTELSISGESFSMDEFTDSVGNKTILRFRKIVPAVKITFNNKDIRSTITNSIQWKTYLLREQGLSFNYDSVHQNYKLSFPKANTYVNQLKLVTENHRELYPYTTELQAEQSTDFVRLTLNSNYFFNYNKGGGMSVRLFGGKFIYLGDKTFTKQFITDRYHFNMTGANGYEDYTYSNYFVGRNEFQGYQSQQIMIRDGGFKVRTDQLSAKVGKTDDWLAALNFRSTIPKNINPLNVLPVKIPFSLFFDVGTYAEAWQKNASSGKFIYDGGIQLTLLHEFINIYIPVIYSKVYSSYFKSTITKNLFWKNISFSIDIQKFNQLKINHQPLL